jgi:hypothetical protein
MRGFDGVRGFHPKNERAPMRTRGLKALFTLLALNKTSNKQPDWGRIILIFSNGVTVGLIALYVFGKATSRW